MSSKTAEEVCDYIDSNYANLTPFIDYIDEQKFIFVYFDGINSDEALDLLWDDSEITLTYKKEHSDEDSYLVFNFF